MTIIMMNINCRLIWTNGSNTMKKWDKQKAVTSLEATEESTFRKQGREINVSQFRPELYVPEPSHGLGSGRAGEENMEWARALTCSLSPCRAHAPKVAASPCLSWAGPVPGTTFLGPGAPGDDSESCSVYCGHRRGTRVVPLGMITALIYALQLFQAHFSHFPE